MSDFVQPGFHARLVVLRDNTTQSRLDAHDDSPTIVAVVANIVLNEIAIREHP